MHVPQAIMTSAAMYMYVPFATMNEFPGDDDERCDVRNPGDDERNPGDDRRTPGDDVLYVPQATMTSAAMSVPQATMTGAAMDLPRGTMDVHRATMYVPQATMTSAAMDDCGLNALAISCRR